MCRSSDEITKLKTQPPFDNKIDNYLRYYADMYVKIALEVSKENKGITVENALKAMELSIMHFSRDIDDENIAGINSSLLRIDATIDDLNDTINSYKE